MEQVAHRPVLPREVLQALACRRGGVWADGTVGAGGHADAILQATSPDGRLVGCDRDAAVLEVARRRLLPYGDRVLLRHLDHRHLPELLDELGLRDLDGILFDLGLSSFQVDDAERGFSFRADGPLDMRMDRRQAKTAADLVNELPERDLRDLLARFGEEPHAAQVARAIVEERAREPFTRTARLAEVVRSAIPRGGARSATTIHPATLTFQALRIAVNDEIGYLPDLLEAAVERLRVDGRLAVISFHSLEDRAVKESFRGMAHCCVCPRDLPRCGCGRPDRVRLITKGAVRPGAEEVRDNPRSRSARLRAVERLEAA